MQFWADSEGHPMRTLWAPDGMTVTFEHYSPAWPVATLTLDVLDMRPSPGGGPSDGLLWFLRWVEQVHKLHRTTPVPG